MDSWSIPIDELCKQPQPADHLPATVHGIGNKDLIRLSWTAFFCSVRCPGSLVLKAYDLAQKLRAEEVPVICGFHSPVEKEVFRILLASRVPVCMVCARSLPARYLAEVRKAIADGRLMVLSPFDREVRRATQETAVLRNRFVGSIANAVLIAYAGSGSKTQQLATRLLAERKPVYTFEHSAHSNLFSHGAKDIKEYATITEG